MEASLIKDLEEDIKAKQQELNQLKYKDVYDAQDAYEAAQVVYKDAEKSMVDKDIDMFLNNKREWCILKLSPTCKLSAIDRYYNMGFRQFHCSNTIPVAQGGLSGKALIPYNKKLIKHTPRGGGGAKRPI